MVVASLFSMVPFLLTTLFFITCFHTLVDAKTIIDPQCRHIDSNEEPVASADIIVIGSGPGGAGFVHRLVRVRPDLSIIWIEKGSNFKALNWPDDIVEEVDGRECLTTIPRKTLTWLTGYAWNNFGGGDAGNSGGANILLTEIPYDPVNVVALRNHSVIPPTETTDRWIEGFVKGGFFHTIPPSTVKTNQNDLISQPSSLRTEDGRDRLLLADDLRYNTVNRNVTYVHGRVASVIRDEVSGRAVGVRGVRIDNDQNEYGGCVAWKASTAVVLAGGIFNSFDVLVESGIGPERYLNVRDVPKSWWTPDESVGKKLGDEHTVTYVQVDPGNTDQFGAEPRLIAEDTYGSAYELWTKGLLDWFRLRNTSTDITFGKIRIKFPKIYNILDWFLKGCHLWSIGIDGGEPMIELEAIPKPLNTTLLPFYPPAVENYLKYPFQSPITLITESLLYKKTYKTGIIVDDSKVQVSDEMCEAITQAMIPMYEGGKILEKVQVPIGKKLRRFGIWFVTKFRFTEWLVRPNVATIYNVQEFTGKGKNKGKKCSTRMFVSLYHWFGGNADLVDSSYQVKGTPGLFVSDGSVLSKLSPGPPSTTIMQTGMRVADALVNML